MRALGWIVGVLGVLAVEAAIAFALLAMSIEENCDNGIDRWSCNETFHDSLVLALFMVPALAIFVALISVKKRQAGR